MNIQYFIINTADVTQEMIDCSTDTNAFTLRYSLDSTKVVLKYYMDKVPLSIKLLDHTLLSRSELLELLSTPEWESVIDT